MNDNRGRLDPIERHAAIAVDQRGSHLPGKARWIIRTLEILGHAPAYFIFVIRIAGAADRRAVPTITGTRPPAICSCNGMFSNGPRGRSGLALSQSKVNSSGTKTFPNKYAIVAAGAKHSGSRPSVENSRLLERTIAQED